MKRKEARELCMQLVYEMTIKNEFSLAGYQHYREQNPDQRDQDAYIQQVLTSVTQQHEPVEQLIRSYAIDWEMDRIARVDLAILRVAMAEMQDLPDIPSFVSVNEAIEMAKKFSTENSSSFVNGILGHYLRDRGEDRAAVEAARKLKADEASGESSGEPSEN